MKKGETPELSAKWWKASQPKGLSSGGRFEMALKAHEVTTAGFAKEANADRLKAALNTLDAVKDAAQKVIAEAGKAKNDAEMEFTVQALKKIDFAKETKALEGAVQDDEDEDDPSTLADPKEYANALRKSLKRVKSTPVNWGFLVGKKPVQHRFLVHRSKSGRALAAAAAKELNQSPKISFGTTIRSPDDDTTIILTVQGAMLAGLATRIKKMLLKMKPQAVTDVILMVDNQVVPETVDPDDVDEADEDGLEAAASVSDPRFEKMRQARRAIANALQQAAGTSVSTSTAIADHQQAFDAALAGQDYNAAREHLFELVALSKRVQAGNDGARAGLVEFGKLRIEWVDAKAKVAAALDDLRSSIEDDEDDEDAEIFGRAVGKLDNVLARFNKGLTKALDDLASAADPIARAPLLTQAGTISDDYINYLTTSPVVKHIDSNPYGVDVDAEAELAEPLRRLKTQLASAA